MWEQLGMILRYLKNGKPTERVVKFNECDSITGVAICEKIIQFLIRVNLPPKLCQAQTYDVTWPVD